MQNDEKVFQDGIKRARNVRREDALQKVVKVKEKKPPHLIVKYDKRTSPGLARIVGNNHHAMVGRDRRMGKVFYRPPRVVFERHRNLKDILTRARAAPAKYSERHITRELHNSVTRCSKGRGRNGCLLCPFLPDRPSEVVKEVVMAPSGQVEQVQGKLTCKQARAGYLSAGEHQDWCRVSGSEWKEAAY